MNPPFDCILLIDHDHINNYVTRHILEKLQLSNGIHAFENGETALEYMVEYSCGNQNRCPDLILLEMEMPMMSGFQFLRLIREFNFVNVSEIKIIVLSNFVIRKDLSELKKHLNIICLEKPLTETALVRAFLEFDLSAPE